jgi:hypothetical protein
MLNFPPEGQRTGGELFPELFLSVSVEVRLGNLARLPLQGQARVLIIRSSSERRKGAGQEAQTESGSESLPGCISSVQRSSPDVWYACGFEALKRTGVVRKTLQLRSFTAVLCKRFF